ncbi:scavenger receptor cysteine-rich type 1 protein M130-like isoform X1 [Siniperca chuatsi]|uniref:scavenger receptor cysteine-rich type 1 protein M130-like isoform X1 n=1 Tax=Siniperca chuatsi TaxID=119488 RepID=UPI001CE0B6B0|nr:scavenger receptor cysteine-rich type 1 protein M130-like isoform X1 [Siniperca chuatsi]
MTSPTDERRQTVYLDMDHLLMLLLMLLLWSSGLRAEGKHISPGAQCETTAKADIVLLVDDSGSLSNQDFKIIQSFASSIVSTFYISPDGVQIGLVLYSDEPKTKWHLNTHSTKHSLLEAIAYLQHMGGGTMTGSALNYILQNNFKPNVGMRADSQKIVVLITDGMSIDDILLPSQNLKDAGIELYAIGLNDADMSELWVIASDPKEIHIHDVKDFLFFQNMLCNSANRLVFVKLVNGMSLCSGRLEVRSKPSNQSNQSNQSWSSVCEADFDQQDAEVVCRELGCGAPLVLQGALYGVLAPMWTKEFQCGGNESALLDCRSSDSARNTCSPGKAVGLTCSEPVRLVGGASRCAGTLEVKRGDWRPVYGFNWNPKSAAAVCRELDCGSAVSTRRRDDSSIRIAWEITSDCIQSGSALRECVSPGSSSSIMEITCSEPVRLVGGASRCAGTLEVKRGDWRPVYGSSWTLKSAAAVCRELDCGSAVSTRRRDDSSIRFAWKISSDCIQSGSALRECVSPGYSSSIMEITCSDSVRLVNGTNLCSGRLEVRSKPSKQSNHSWSSVCEADFDHQDAEVVCRELGCGAPSVLQGALYGEVEAPMWTKEFQCGGNESALLDCRSSDSARNTCSPGKDVGLTCSEPVRLVGGASRCAGTLEVKQGDWRPVYGSSWTLKSAAAVCRELDCGSAVSTRRRDDSSIRFAWEITSDCIQSGSALRECVSPGSSIMEITCSDPVVLIIRLVVLPLTLLLFIIVNCFIHKATRGQKPGPQENIELDHLNLGVCTAEGLTDQSGGSQF